jgi:hypothetical protein
LGGFAISVLTIGAILYICRRRRHSVDISIETETVSPFTTPRLDRGFTSDTKIRSATGERVTTIGSMTSESWSPVGDRYMQPESPQRSSDTNTYQVGSTLSSPVLAQLGEVVIGELLSLRTQVRQLQETQWGLTDNGETPPEYS